MGNNKRFIIRDDEVRNRMTSEHTSVSSMISTFMSVVMLGIFLCIISCSPAFSADSVGNFTGVVGRVDILREGKFPAIPASLSGDVFLKDIIRTKSNSKAEITFNDNTVLRIAQRSRIDIGEYFTGDDAGKGVIKLQRGLIRSVVDKNVSKRISLAPEANRFEVQTPNAVAGVRGTDFFVSFDRNATTVLLRDGEVCVSNVNNPEAVVCLPPGFIVTVSGDGMPGQIRKATDMELNIFDRETSPLIPFTGKPSIQDGELAAFGSSPPAGGIEVPAQPAAPSAYTGPVTRTPSNITDTPFSRPLTEEFPGGLEPSPPPPPPPPPPPSETFGSSFGSDIWSAYPEKDDGSFTADMVSFETLWTSGAQMPAGTSIEGIYLANSSLPHIWFSQDVFSFNSSDSTKTTFDGGAYTGFIGAREADNNIEAIFGGIFIDPSGNTGILAGEFSGFADGSSLNMNGGLYPVQMGTTTIPPGVLYDAVQTSVFSMGVPGLIDDAVLIGVSSGTNLIMNLSGQSDWGISQMLLGGTYTDMVNDDWAISISGSSAEGNEFSADLNGSRWSGNKLDASVSGFWADAGTTSPSTGIYIGETFGTFNPADHTWQAVASGVILETKRFIQMASTEAGRNKLQQLNIPAVEIGRTNLSGSLLAGQEGAFDFVSVSMNDVIFFAPATGQKPGIWATNSVTGQYDFRHGFITAGNVTGPDNVISISNGKDLSAEFQFTGWNNNTWKAAVKNGTGNLEGGSYNGPLDFNGVSAGTHTGSNSGSLSGTGAGVSR
jgi:hypothetical protein